MILLRPNKDGKVVGYSALIMFMKIWFVYIGISSTPSWLVPKPVDAVIAQMHGCSFSSDYDTYEDWMTSAIPLRSGLNKFVTGLSFS